MTRLLKINGEAAEIDDKTAIGITYQSYDLKKPGERKVKISNNFTIPGTSKNLQKFGFANNPQTTSKKVYGANFCDYWVGNEALIEGAKCRVEEMNDRIKLFTFQKPDVWDQIKLLKWPDFVVDFVSWLQSEKGLPSSGAPFLGNFGEFIEPYTENTEGLILPFYLGNLYNYAPNEEEEENFLETPTDIWLKYWPTDQDQAAEGGHFCVFAKTVFEYLEHKYDVNFLTEGGQAIGNIWDDEFALAMYTPIRDITVRFSYDGPALQGFYFDAAVAPIYQPLEDVKDKGDKTLHDFVNSFFQHLNIIKDEIQIGNTDVIRLARFDDLKEVAEVVEWSGKMSDVKPKFRPYIKGYKQSNSIKFKSIFPEGDAGLGSKTLTCLNENLDASGDLFGIDAYVCSFLGITDGIVPDLSISESFKTFSFFINSGLSSDIVNIKASEDSAEQVATFRLQKPVLYSLSGEYNFLDEILDYPVFYETELWLTINDVKDLQFFRQYFIRELGGSFFINKISGFNPQKSLKATKVELIKLGNRTPITPPTLDYWTDGVGDGFTDGEADLFF